MDAHHKSDDNSNSSTRTDTNTSGQQLIVIKKSRLQKIDKLVFRYGNLYF